MPTELNPFMLGALVMACIVAGLFFLRFWRKTRDRLFIIFAIAFWLLGVNWLLLALTAQAKDEVRAAFYVIRLLAFVLILIAIIDKNRPRSARHQRRDAAADGTGETVTHGRR